MKVGLTLLKQEWESPLSPHFGIAKWLLVYDTETEHKLFERNDGLEGHAVVEFFETQGCTDAICSRIGPGALDMLSDSGIRCWVGPNGVAAPELIESLQQGNLKEAQATLGDKVGERKRRRRSEAKSARGGGQGKRHRHGYGGETAGGGRH